MHTMPMIPQIDLPQAGGQAQAGPTDPTAGAKVFGQTLATAAQDANVPANPMLHTPVSSVEPQVGEQSGWVAPLLAVGTEEIVPDMLAEALPATLTEGMTDWDAQLVNLADQLPDDPAELAKMVQQMAPELRAKLQQQMQQAQEISKDIPADAVELATTELHAGQVPVVDPAQVQQPLRQALAQATQGTFDEPVPAKAVPSQSSEMVLETEAATAEKVVPGHLKQEMDERFAQLLNPKANAVEPTLRQAQSQGLRDPLQGLTAQVETSEGLPQVEQAVKPQAEVDALHTLMPGRSQSAETPVNSVVSQAMGPQVQNIQQPQAPVTNQPMVQLPSGQQVAETVIVDQVVTHLSGSQDGETGKMVLRLKPAELGELKLDLVVDSDRLKVQLQAQTQQVQEVIERHLPKLRDALEQQGLKVDEFQVNVDSDDNQQGQFAQEQAEQQQNWQAQGHRYGSEAWGMEMNEEIAMPLPQAMTAGGISLHV